MPTALEFELKKQCPPGSANSMLPVSVLRSASFAALGLRLGPATVRGVATQSAKVMLAILALRLLPVSVIARTKSLSVASPSVQTSKWTRQMVPLLAIVQVELLSVEWSSVQTSMLQPQTALVSP